MQELVLEVCDAWQHVLQFVELTQPRAHTAVGELDNALDRLSEAAGVPMPAEGPYEPFRPTPDQGVLI